MKQILQNLKNGDTEIEEVPSPGCRPGHLLIKTTRTLVSAGTERMLVEFGKANLIDKARQQPDKVKQVFDKVKTDGLAPTIAAVQNKLDQSLPLGYCNVGTVVEVGDGVTGFKPGDRVVSNGKHAEVVCVPQNLCAKVPPTVADEDAAFTVIAAIALQGIRLIQPTLGETVVVTGLGLIGLVAVQLLRAHGCRVLGIDFDSAKVELAKQLGAQAIDLSNGEDPLLAAQQLSRHRGVDAVLITASTKSNEPIHQAATMCRQRGRMVPIGVVGMEMSRADFYEKELSFQVSCSYGPGRYDPAYEDQGHDYPYAFVRWTEQRNFEAILDMMAEKRIDMQPLISHRYNLDKATEAYELVSGGNPLGILLQFDSSESATKQSLDRTVTLSKSLAAASVGIGFIGSGSYATSVLIPAFAKTDAALVVVSCNAGVSGTHVAKKMGIANVTTDTDALIKSDTNNTVVISSRHDSHAELVIKSLAAGKHVFVEKPLAITRDDLQAISNKYYEVEKENPVQLMVGFNRRFSPFIQKAKELLQRAGEPASFIYTINAGAIPADHWTQDLKIGGGRLLGEACHFVDLLRYLADASIVTTKAIQIGSGCQDGIQNDKVTILLAFENGSMGTVHYLANGNKSFPKERLEIFCAGAILQLDNFRKMKGYGWPGFKRMSMMKQDKGNNHCAKAFVDAIESGAEPLIPFAELYEVSEACLDIMEQISA